MMIDVDVFSGIHWSLAMLTVSYDHKLGSIPPGWFSFKVTYPAEMNLIQTLTFVVSDAWVLSDSSSGALDLIISRVKLLSSNKSLIRMVFWNEVKVLAMGFLKERISWSWKKPFWLIIQLETSKTNTTFEFQIMYAPKVWLIFKEEVSNPFLFFWRPIKEFDPLMRNYLKEVNPIAIFVEYESGRSIERA